ncbi:multidrug effflux MFS transporter [Geminicoccus roseus]|uniref:multidrug effflux MFS transporter n=1 Tax=Geminicoccus roseus TaxID=404900 RepID=UPI0003FDF467|nr:multidrug effflux MFS transporter [Geminicoccus roseus]
MIRDERAFLLLLVLLTGLGPAALQIFLPALPVIRTDLATSSAAVQLTLSLSTLSIAVSMLLFGPISDRIGRRPAVLGGLAVFLLGSAGCVLADSVTILVIARVVQAAGGAAGMVIARAMIRDRHAPEDAASMLAIVTTAMVVAPMIAPVVGGGLTDMFGWRSTFAASGIAGLLILAAAFAGLPETHPPSTGARHGPGLMAGSARLLVNREFIAYALQSAFSMALYYALLGGGAYVVMEVLGGTATHYALWFLPVAFMFMIGNLVASRISRRFGIDRMVLWGCIGNVAGTGLSLFLIGFVALAPWAIFLPAALVAFFQGLSVPNAQAGALSVDAKLAGTASGLSGFLQMAFAACAAQFVGFFQNGTPWPMVLTMFACAVFSFLAFMPRLAPRPAIPAG